MLLSTVLSLLLARGFRGRAYVVLMTIILSFMSMFSFGFPSVWVTEWSDDGRIVRATYWKVNLPAVPLSFPFYASISELERFIPTMYPTPLYRVKLQFLTTQLWTNKREYIDPNIRYSLASEDIFLLASFFLLINIVGTIIGYWISYALKVLKGSNKMKQNTKP